MYRIYNVQWVRSYKYMFRGSTVTPKMRFLEVKKRSVKGISSNWKIKFYWAAIRILLRTTIGETLTLFYIDDL